MKCYSHLISRVHGHTHRWRDLNLWKYTPADLVSAPSVRTCMCVCVCVRACVCTGGGLWVEWSATLKPNRIFQSRAAERLIEAYCMPHSEGKGEKILQWVGHAVTTCWVFNHNEILKTLKFQRYIEMPWAWSDWYYSQATLLPCVHLSQIGRVTQVSLWSGKDTENRESQPE